MFEWLEQEIASINTPHFHEIDGPVSDELRRAILKSPIYVPPSYKEFAVLFGNAKLYRCHSWYKVEVLASPRIERAEDGEEILRIGRTEGALVYFRSSLLAAEQESPVFEWHGPPFGWTQSAPGFEVWIAAKCAAARKKYSKKEWRTILDGPVPFTPEEEAIVRARSQFRWRVIGIAEDGNLQFEVRNGSSMILPYLTVGIRHKGGDPFGGVKVPIAQIGIGETGIIEVDCYKASHSPHSIEAFDKPAPEPALRDLYWEFRQLSD